LTPKFKDVDNLVDMLTYSMGGPSIDGGSYNAEQSEVIRYTPPVPEFEVMIFHVDPGNSLEYENPGVPAILIVLEGSGLLDGKLCRPGRSYYWPAGGPSLNFSVDKSRRGPMKVALAHKNCHLSRPTTVNRLDFGGHSSHRTSVPASPMPYMGRGRGSPNFVRRTAGDDDDDTPFIEESSLLAAQMPPL
jgi:hypothetical protein